MTKTGSTIKQKKVPGGPSITETKHIEKYQYWMHILPHCEDFIEYKNHPNKTMANFYKKVVEQAKLEDTTPKALEKQLIRGPFAWVKEFKTMVASSSSGVPRVGYAEITGLKFIDKIVNKKLVDAFLEFFGNQKKFANDGVEPDQITTTSTKQSVSDKKFQSLNDIESNQKRALNIIENPII